jgi:hypothetical protein
MSVVPLVKCSSRHVLVGHVFGQDSWRWCVAHQVAYPFGLLFEQQVLVAKAKAAKSAASARAYAWSLSFDLFPVWSAVGCATRASSGHP